MFTDDIHRINILILTEGEKTNFMAPFREQILFFQHSCLDYRCKHTHASVSVVKSVYTSHLSVCSKQTHSQTPMSSNTMLLTELPALPLYIFKWRDERGKSFAPSSPFFKERVTRRGGNITTKD